MGCDFSKQQDVNAANRQRVKTNDQQPITTETIQQNNNNNNATHTVPVHATIKKLESEENVSKSLAESFTDFKMKEKEMFEKILNKTGRKFIDVSNSPSLIVAGGEFMGENQYPIEEEQDNEERLKEIEKEIENSNLFDMPTTNHSNVSAIQHLSKKTDDNTKIISRVGDLLQLSIKNIKINESIIGGELVVQLPTLSDETNEE